MGRAQTPDSHAQTVGPVQQASPETAKNTSAQSAQSGVAVAGRIVQSTADKRQQREAEDAYLAGAKKLERDDLDAAEREFQRALKLDPDNPNYPIAITVTREHRLAELVQHASKARQSGDSAKADALLAEARAIDPENPVVLEHSGPYPLSGVSAQQPDSPTSRRAESRNVPQTPTADRILMLADPDANEPWRIKGPTLAGAIRLTPEDTVKSFHLSGTSQDVIRNIASAYGIRAVMDDSVEQKNLRFNLEGVTYQRAMAVAMSMAHVFAVPVDETSVLIAKDDSANRQRLDRQLQETIFVPGLTTEQINDLVQVVKTVFDVKQASVQTGLGDIEVRAPQDVLEPLNRTLKDLIEGSGEVMIEVKLYEVDSTRMTTAGATIPTQAGIYNVGQAASSLVSGNQSLVQQAIAQGLISATASNYEIAAALIASGLVQSSLLSSTIGVFGNGITQTGITESGSVAFNLGLNSADTRTLDDVQLRVGDRQAATFREGNKYPITTSTYTSGISTAASTVGNATINGVSVASLLKQYSGGSSATIPQVTYEDIGVTLKATPTIQKSGRISMSLDLKIEALSGSSLDGNPVLQSRQFTTGLTLGDGDSALMVSNVSRNETAAMTGIPGLSELPGFELPLEDNVEKDSSQLVVVVTPHIVRRRSDMVAGPRIPVRAQMAN